MNRDPLTARQQVIYDFIKLYIAKHHMAPTREEIREAFAFRSPNAAQSHVEHIASKGYIRLNRSWRGIELV